METSIITVYLVEDHDLVREGIRTMLQRERGFKIVGDTADPFQAIREINEINPRVTILDINFHESSLNGFDVVKQLKEANTETRILLLTGFNSNLYISEALRLEVCGLITKERSQSLLVKAIQLVAEGISVWDTCSIIQNAKIISRQNKRENAESKAIFESQVGLTFRELKVVQLLDKGYSNKQISKELGYSEASTKKYVHACIRKLGVKNRVQVALSTHQDDKSEPFLE
ncbi:MAG: response regulator [Dehalogenimonas sp.]